MSRLIKKVDGLTNMSYRPIKVTQTVFGNPGDQEALEGVFKKLYEYEELEERGLLIKQNPYKPVKKAEIEQYSGVCMCGHRVFDCNEYCSDCGIKLDWE